MGILMMLKEGGSLVIDTIGNLPISEDLDLLPNAGSLSTTFRIIMDSFFITSSNSSQAYAIVMGD